MFGSSNGQLKTSGKKLDSLKMKVNVGPRNILESGAKTVVVMKTGDKTDPGGLENELFGFGLMNDKNAGLLEGNSALGRSKVVNEIIAQEQTDILLLLFPLEQTLSLHGDHVKKLVPFEIDKKDLDGLMGLSCDEHQEIATRVMVKFVTSEKKNLIKSICPQVLRIPMKFFKLIPIGKFNGTPDSKIEGTLMCTQLNETILHVIMKTSEVNSKYDGTPMTKTSFKSKSPAMCTPMVTPPSTPNSKSKSTPMCTPSCTPTSTPNSKSKPNGTLMFTLLYETSNTVNLMSIEVRSISECTPLDTPRSTPEPKIRDKYQDQSTKFEGTPNSMSVGTPICTLKDTPMCTPISTPKSKSYCTPMGPPDAKKRVAHKAESAYQSVWMIVNFEEVYLSKIRVRRSVQVLIFPSEDVSKYTLIQDSEVKRKFFQVVNE